MAHDGLEHAMCGSNRQPIPVNEVRSWQGASHRQCAVWLVSAYYTRPFRGAQFDELAGGGLTDVITENELMAVRSQRS